MVFSVTIPICLILTYGVFFLVFISGVEKKKSFLRQLFNDIISMSAFMLRFVLQNMRVILLVTYSWVFTMACHDELHSLVNNSRHNPTLFLILIQAKFVFEFLDVVMIFIVQLFTFVTVLTCLFSFVLLIEEKFTYESFFDEKRNSNKKDTNGDF